MPDERPTIDMPKPTVTEIVLGEIRAGIKDVQGTLTTVSNKQSVQGAEQARQGVEQRRMNDLLEQHDVIIKTLQDIPARSARLSDVARLRQSVHDGDGTNQEQNNRLDALEAKIDDSHKQLLIQSNWMGIGRKGIDWATGAEGQKKLIALATLAGVLYAAFMSGRH